MKLLVPSHPTRSWQMYFGHLCQLLHESGVIKRANVHQQRAVIAAAYQVRLARFFPIESVDTGRLTSIRLRIPETFERTSRIRLNDILVFAPTTNEDFSINPAFEAFVIAIPERRLLDFIRWYPPKFAASKRNAIPLAFSDQLIASIVRYRLPHLKVVSRKFKSPPTRQLSLLEIAALTDHIFGHFVDSNTELICRLCYTSDEAALLIGKSRNTAAIIRKEMGVLTP